MNDKNDTLHKLLKRQIRNFLSPELANDPALNKFINAVNESYAAFENDKDLLNHAFNISETEYRALYESLSKEHELKKNSIEKLKQAIRRIDLKNEVKFNDEVESIQFL